ncbi:MAG: hypothetical protein GY854_34385 [Deltaproteobacteria bacterium]|nr:hypothetical protein [Deltaproteobacteria bacterium]
MMIQYFLIALLFIGTLWLAITLGRVALRIWISKRKNQKAAGQVASRVVDAELMPGGNPDTPLPIRSPAVVEAKASGYSCPFCDVDLIVQAHRAIEHQGRRLRVAELQCRRCEHRQNIYFELMSVN